jgi:hypothetical protein
MNIPDDIPPLASPPTGNTSFPNTALLIIITAFSAALIFTAYKLLKPKK